MVSESIVKGLVIAVLAGGAVLAIARWLDPVGPAGGARSERVIAEPARLSELAARGKILFEATCAECHGRNGAGTDQGPSFINDIYNPGHHSDEAFLLAPRVGVRAHHWKFGDMPPVEGVTDADLRAIVRYVREIQEANGIVFKPHVM
jgi:mono/diheme cytochrome c family protein